MVRKVIVVLFLLFIFYTQGQSQQACTTLGQTPSTAFPVCATTTFHQNTVPACVNNSVHANGCGSYPDLNPFWYQFTCYISGTLGFTITPTNLNDDYDWELFDITGHSPVEVYTNPALFVAADWSGNTSLESARGYTGVTGTSGNAQNTFECASNPPELGGNPPYNDASTFVKMPNITQGHTYLLLVSHFSGSNQSGYGLAFSGGTASIVDPLKPQMKSATTDCSGSKVYVNFNKQLQCKTLSSNGSEFQLSPSLANVIAASGVNCNNAFDMDSVLLTLDKPLPPGNYNLFIKSGSDNNTLSDDVLR